MDEKKTFPKRLKAQVIAVGVVAFLVLCVWGAELWVKCKIRGMIEKEAAALTENGVNVEMGRISVSLVRRSVTVRDVRLKSQNGDPGRSGFTIVSLDAGVEKVLVQGVGYKKKDGKPALSAAAIEITAPYATIVTQGKKPDDGKPKKSLQESITEKLSSVNVDKISVSGAKLDYVAWKNGADDGTRISIENGDLTVEKFALDSLPAPAGKILFSDNVILAADRISYGYSAGDFVLQADTLAVNAADGSLFLKSAALIPQHPKDEFAQRSARHSDWTEFSLSELNCTGVDFAGLVNGKTLTVDSLWFASGHVASYKNRQVWQEPRTKPMLYQTIQNLPIGIDVRTMSFSGLGVEYYELAAGGDSQGKVVFTEGAGTARNVTNVAAGHGRFMTIDITARLMDNGPMHAVFLFPVSPADNHWEVSGNLGKMDLASLNRAIEPLANVKIKAGTIHGLDFRITGTLTHSHVDLTMLYNDLSVAFMKKNEQKERKFMTFIADGIILRSDNPKKNGKVRPGTGEFERDPQKSMYNFMWKSLFQGVKSTVM